MKAWILALLFLVAPPDRATPIPGWLEAPAARRERYARIADDIVAVATTPRDAALLVAIASHESAFAPDADRGPCAPGRCDGGRAVSLWQLHARNADDARALFADRRLAARRALDLAHRSAHACIPLHGADAALRLYASGSCERGGKASREMVLLAARLLAVGAE